MSKLCSYERAVARWLRSRAAYYRTQNTREDRAAAIEAENAAQGVLMGSHRRTRFTVKNCRCRTLRKGFYVCWICRKPS